MKTLLSFLSCLCLVLAIPKLAIAGDNDINVLSYYAVGNSLDGQPLIDRINVLRFFPVFAMRDSVQYAKVTVYYGGNIYSRYATRMEHGKYWEVLLPQFRLGEAIQRIEVETHIHLQQNLLIRTFREVRDIHARNKETYFTMMRSLLDGITTTANKNMEQINQSITSTIASLTAALSSNLQSLTTSTSQIEVTTLSLSYINVDGIKGKIEEVSAATHTYYTSYHKNIINDLKTYMSINNCTTNTPSCYETLLLFSPKSPDPFPDININDYITIASRNAILQTQKLVESIQSQITTLQQLIPQYDNQLKAITIQIQNFKHQTIATIEIEKVFESLRGLQDSLYAQILHNVEANLIDTSYSGPSVQRSDILLDSNLMSATILYRNYKTSLRHLPALDPAERLGVFRARYIPFAVTGTKLHRPLSEKSQAIFEVGLAFGDAIVTGDDFVVAEFSPRRLGVAFAITDKLFASDAEVLALALTYDFNSYGSIAFGANFRTSEVSQHRIVERYMSFGINKRAFEVLIGQLKLLFL